MIVIMTNIIVCTSLLKLTVEIVEEIFTIDPLIPALIMFLATA